MADLSQKLLKEEDEAAQKHTGDVEGSPEARRHVMTIVLPATVFLGLSVGSSLAFSAILVPIIHLDPTWSRDVVIHALAGFFGIIGITSVIVGKYMLKWGRERGPKIWVLLGAVSCAIGLALQAVAVKADQEWLFLLSFIIFSGFSGGVLFITGIQYVAFWVPKRRGIAGGFMGGCVGVGALIFNQILSRVAADSDAIWSLVTVCFLATFCAVVFIPFIRFPSYMTAPDPNAGSQEKLSTRDMLKTWQLWVASGMIAFTLIGGYGIVADLDNMFDTVVYGGSGGIVVSSSAANAGTIAFAFYAMGRFAMGFVCDRIGLHRTYLLIATVQLICLMCLPTAATNDGTAFVVITAMTLTVCGGGKVLAAAIAAYIYGKQNSSLALGLLLCFGQVTAGILGPELIAKTGLRTNNSDQRKIYNTYFYVTGGFQIISILCTLSMRKYDFSKRHAQQQQQQTELSSGANLNETSNA